MAFLTNGDYTAKIKDKTLSQLIESDTSIRLKDEAFAEEFVKSYLRTKYDIQSIFSAVGDSRNYMVVDIYLTIVIYKTYLRINHNQVPEMWVNEYENAKKLLEMIARGELQPDLPVLELFQEQSNTTRFVSRTTKTNPENTDKWNY